MMPLPHEIFLLEHYYFASARNLLLTNYNGVYGMAVKVSHSSTVLLHECSWEIEKSSTVVLPRQYSIILDLVVSSILREFEI